MKPKMLMLLFLSLWATTGEAKMRCVMQYGKFVPVELQSDPSRKNTLWAPVDDGGKYLAVVERSNALVKLAVMTNDGRRVPFGAEFPTDGRIGGRANIYGTLNGRYLVLECVE